MKRRLWIFAWFPILVSGAYAVEDFARTGQARDAILADDANKLASFWPVLASEERTALFFSAIRLGARASLNWMMENGPSGHSWDPEGEAAYFATEDEAIRSLLKSKSPLLGERDELGYLVERIVASLKLSGKLGKLSISDGKRRITELEKRFLASSAFEGTEVLEIVVLKAEKGVFEFRYRVDPRPLSGFGGVVRFRKVDGFWDLESSTGYDF